MYLLPFFLLLFFPLGNVEDGSPHEPGSPPERTALGPPWTVTLRQHGKVRSTLGLIGQFTYIRYVAHSLRPFAQLHLTLTFSSNFDSRDWSGKMYIACCLVKGWPSSTYLRGRPLILLHQDCVVTCPQSPIRFVHSESSFMCHLCEIVPIILSYNPARLLKQALRRGNNSTALQMAIEPYLPYGLARFAFNESLQNIKNGFYLSQQHRFSMTVLTMRLPAAKF